MSMPKGSLIAPWTTGQPTVVCRAGTNPQALRALMKEIAALQEWVNVLKAEISFCVCVRV